MLRPNQGLPPARALPAPPHPATAPDSATTPDRTTAQDFTAAREARTAQDTAGTADRPACREGHAPLAQSPSPVVGWLLIPAGLEAELDAPDTAHLRTLRLYGTAGPRTPAA